MTAIETPRFGERFEQLDRAFRARAPRERVLLSLLALAAIAYLVDGVAVRPIEESRKRVLAETAARTSAIESLEQQIETARQGANGVASDPAQAELRRLEEQVARIDAGISSAVERLIPPEAAAEILEELLAGDERLKLVRLTSAPPRKLGLELAQGGRLLYQHRITIEVEGDFASTLAYLRRIEGSRWQLLWDRLEYRVEQFPDANVTIELHTLSEREEWVGV